MKIFKGLNFAGQASAPSSPANGDTYYDTTLNKLRCYENGAWVNLSDSDGSIVLNLGSASAPSLAFTGDSNTGIYSAGADNFNITTGGTLRLSVDTTAITSALPLSASNFTPTSSTVPVQGMYRLGTGVAAISSDSLPVANFSANGTDAWIGIHATSGNKAIILNQVSDGITAITGGNSSTSAANLHLYGDTHATKASDIELRVAAAVKLGWDQSASTWTMEGQLQIPDVAYLLDSGGPNLQFRGTTGETSFIYQAVNDGLMNLSGGSSSSDGANLRLFGGTHATQARDIELRSGATNVLTYDHSALTWTSSVSLTANNFIPSNSTVPSNGIYLPAANTVGIAANSLAHVRFSDSSGAKVVQFDTTSGNGSFIRNAVADGLMSISSSTASSSGANLRMFGDTHATQARDIELRTDGTNRLAWDHSASTWILSTQLQIPDVAYLLDSGGPNLQFRGTTGETSFIYQAVNDGLMNMSGGSGSTSGLNIRVFGGAHSTQASDLEVRAGSTVVLFYDHSATNFTIGASGNTTTHAINGATSQTRSQALARFDVASAATIAALDSTRSFVKLTGSTATTLQGITAGADGQRLTLVNLTGQNLTVSNENGTASAANRITTMTGADITTTADGAAEFVYDTGSSRWICLYVTA